MGRTGPNKRSSRILKIIACVFRFNVSSTNPAFFYLFKCLACPYKESQIGARAVNPRWQNDVTRCLLNSTKVLKPLKPNKQHLSAIITCFLSNEHLISTVSKLILIIIFYIYLKDSKVNCDCAFR